jgi:hypothetical protein
MRLEFNLNAYYKKKPGCDKDLSLNLTLGFGRDFHRRTLAW